MDNVSQLYPDNVKEEKDEKQEETPTYEKSFIESWFKKIEKAEKRFETDFERMRDSMDFVCGMQWKGQPGIEYDKYIANWTIRAVNQGVATLYAKNPKVEVKRNTDRLNYQIWDGKIETIQMASAILQMGQRFGFPIPPDVQELMADFQQGRLRESLVDRVSKTLQYLCQKQMDSQTPNFKTQMKQLVRRVNVCGVGYIKVNFCREDYDEDNYEDLTQSKTRLSMADRILAVKSLVDKIEKGKIEESSADVQRLKSLILSMNVHPLDTEKRQIREHIVYDFPRATSILPDSNTRTLKGFVGAHWIAEVLYLPLSFVNEYFESDIDPSADIKLYDSANKADDKPTSGDEERRDHKNVCLYVIRDLDTKSEFTICKGHKKFLCEPEVVSPVPRDFWNIFPVTFNDVEVEEGCKATIFPPSLVDLIKPAQKEWNRVRESLRRHRRANGPKYMYVDGTASEEDLDAIAEAEDQQFVKLKGVPPGTDPANVIRPLVNVKIEESLYNAEPLREDSLLTSGQQEANQGPPQPNITATGVTVAEQSRMGVAASDVDGLDDALTAAVDCSAQLMLMEMSSDTVKRAVGQGAVWPDDIVSRRELLDEVEITIRAGSSGKPNQAVELNKWQTESQILMQFGANPQAVIRETINRFDDHLEPADFFPIQMPQPQQPQQQQGPKQVQQKPKAKPQQQPQRMLPAGP